MWDLHGWKDVAGLFGVHPDTARRWGRELGMPVDRCNGRVRARAAELAAWAERVGLVVRAS